MSKPVPLPARPEWRTFALIFLCYGVWAACLAGVSLGWPVLAMVGVTLAMVLHSSLSHEVLHGHPFRSEALNEAMMALPLGLAIPYRRFRDQHLEHHRDANLTDPYDDPESNYLDPAVWAVMPRWQRVVFAMNNTLLGRMALGPAIGQVRFCAGDWRLIRAGDRAVLRAWALHLSGVLAVLTLVWLSPMPVWAYLLAAYIAMGILKIRTFLEHQAHENSRGRTVIIEDRGPLAFLFLNNNLHVVHHMNPGASWYQLPVLYQAGKRRYLELNEGYVFRSYAQIFGLYLWRAKDPVPHPLWLRR